MKKRMLISAALSMALAFAFTGVAQAKECRGKHRFEKKDTNKDGSLSQEEFVAGSLMIFEWKDTNKDGTITKEEVTAKAEEKFGKIDANKDGQVTPEEMKAYKKSKWQNKDS